MVADAASASAMVEASSQGKPAARCPFRGWFGGSPSSGSACPFSGRVTDGVASADGDASPKGAPDSGIEAVTALSLEGRDLSSCPHMKENSHASAQDASKCPHVRRVAAEVASAAARGGASEEGGTAPAGGGASGDPAACPHLQRVAAEVAAKAQAGLDPSACPHLARAAAQTAAQGGVEKKGPEEAGKAATAAVAPGSPTSPLSPAASRCPHLRALGSKTTEPGVADGESRRESGAGPAGAAGLAPGSGSKVGAAAYPPEVLAQCPHLRQLVGSGASGASAAPSPSPAAASGTASWAPPLAGSASSAEVRCPLGFGSKRAALSELHCALCKGLYHRATRLEPCGHIFCAGCVRPARTCPTCGADIESRKEAADEQRAVDAFLKDECDRHSIWDLDSAAAWEAGCARARALAQAQAQKGDAAEAEAKAKELCVRGAFLMALALRQGAAGNAEAAGERLFMAIQAFENAKDTWDRNAQNDDKSDAKGEGDAKDKGDERSEGDDEKLPAGGQETAKTRAAAPPCSPCSASQLDVTAPPQTIPELFERLGTAWGALGDLARSAGDAGAAATAYASAGAALSAAVAAAAEAGTPQASSVARSATRALLVTRNKQGDLHYAMGDARGALELYGEALRGRREARARAPGDPALALELATSLVKVADALQWARETGAEASERQSADKGAPDARDPADLLREAKAIADALESGQGEEEREEAARGGAQLARPLDPLERRKLAALRAHLSQVSL